MRTRRDFIAPTAALGTSCATPPSEEPRPNLVFVFPDQMRGSAMGFLGEEPVCTPRLDAFASESLVLTEAASNFCVCSPYRAMLMTGKWSQHNGVTSNCQSLSAPYGVQLRQSDRCWSDVLQDNGYQLGYIGKWHLEAPYEPYVDSYNNTGEMKWNEWCPPERRHGFDFWHSYHTYDRHMNPHYWTTDMTRAERLNVDQWGPEHEVDVAIDFLDQRDEEKPFGLVVSMNPPHTPYTHYPQEKYLDRLSGVSDEELFSRPNIPPADTQAGQYYRRDIRNYFAMISGVDEQFGRLLDALDERDLKDDTIVVFTSDHGDCLGIHYQRHKNNHFEEAIRVPFLIRWPGSIPTRRDDLLLSTPDIYPTLLDLLGLADQVPSEVDGQSHAEVFRGGEGVRPAAQPYMRMIAATPETGVRGVRTDRYTLKMDNSPGAETPVELHDRKSDPYQLENLADARPDLVEQLTSVYIKPWLDRLDDRWSAPTETSASPTAYRAMDGRPCY